MDSTVSVPGLGVFYLKQHSSRLVAKENKIYPPSKEIRFKWKPKTRGDRLIGLLIDEYGLDHIAAREAILAYSDEVKQRYSDTGEADLPGIGRLFHDQNDNLLFDGTGADPVFMKSSLPVLEIQPLKTLPEKQTQEPIHQENFPLTPEEDSIITEDELQEFVEADWETDETTVSQEEVDTAPEMPPPVIEEEVPTAMAIDNTRMQISEQATEPRTANRSARSAYLPLFLVFGLALAGLIAWMLYPSQDTSTEYELTKIDKNRINQSPEKSIADASDVVKGDDITPADSTVLTQPNQTTELDENDLAELPTVNDKTEDSDINTSNNQTGSECIIIVGSFGRKANVKSMESKIRRLGFESYIDSQTLNLTRVGVRVNCSQVTGVLSEVKYKLEKNAWILE